MNRHTRHLPLLAIVLLLVTSCGSGDTGDAVTETAGASTMVATTTSSAPTTTAAATTTSAAPTTTTTAPPPELVVTMTDDSVLSPVNVAWYAAYGSSFVYGEFEVKSDIAWEISEFSATAYDADGNSLGKTSETYLPYVLRPGETVIFMGTYFEGEIQPASVEFNVVPGEEYFPTEFYRAGDGLEVSDVKVFQNLGNWYVSGLLINNGERIKSPTVIAAVYDESGVIVGAEIYNGTGIGVDDILEPGKTLGWTVMVHPMSDVASARAVAGGVFSDFQDG